VAYYLPLDNLSPVRIGRRVLRDSSNTGNNYQAAGQLSAGNRQLLAGYMAGLDLAAAAASNNSSSSCSGTTAAGQLPRRPQLTLQDALLTQRPNFVRRAEHRRAALARIKAARLRRAEKQEAWLEQLRELSPASRARAEPTYSPVPQVGRAGGVFPHIFPSPHTCVQTQTGIRRIRRVISWSLRSGFV
jgi:hypothetical protein